jgi:hypothetical protein
LLTSHSVNGSIHFIFMDFRHVGELLEATRSSYGAPLNLAIWTKTNGGMGSLYPSMHELVFVFKNGKERHINNVALGKRPVPHECVAIPGHEQFRQTP